MHSRARLLCRGFVSRGWSRKRLAKADAIRQPEPSRGLLCVSVSRWLWIFWEKLTTEAQTQRQQTRALGSVSRAFRLE
jgi:hypothetical protein